LYFNDKPFLSTKLSGVYGHFKHEHLINDVKIGLMNESSGLGGLGVKKSTRHPERTLSGFFGMT